MDDDNEDIEWTDTARHRLAAAAERVQAAIVEHVAALSRLSGAEDDYPAVFAANETLGAAVRAYNDANFELSGTAAVPVDVLLGEADGEDDDEEALAPEDTLRLTLQARFDFVVRDEASFVAYVQQRWVTPDVEAADVADHVGDAFGCLSELFQMDGWQTSTYTPHGIEPSGEGWKVGSVPKTLFEMSFNERDEAGF